MSVYAKEYGYFFNSNNSDRKYNASSFEEWLKPFFLPGVFNGELQVTAQSTPNMTVNVAPGHANLDGVPAYWPDTNVITIDTASGVYDRIDTIVLRRDNVNRACSIEYVKGVASISPQPVAPTRNADTYELVLAQVLVGVGVTEITGANITDTRMDSDVCGWVAATVDQIDFDQIKTQFDSWMEVSKAEFEDWFQHLHDELDDNQAAHLQNEIDDLPLLLAFNQSSSYLNVGDYGVNPTYKTFLYKATDNMWEQTRVADAIANRVGDGIAILGSRSLTPSQYKYTPKTIQKGQYFYIQRSIDDDLQVGLYVAKNNVPANTLITTTDFERVEDGGLNALNGNLSALSSVLDGLIYRFSVTAGSSVTVNNVANGALIAIAMSSGNYFVGFKWNVNTIREVTRAGTALTVSADDGNVTVANGGSSSTAYVTIIGGCTPNE